MKRIALALLLLPASAWATGNTVTIGGSGSGGTSSSLATYIQTDDPLAGSDPCNTGDTWHDTTQNTWWVCENGATDAWARSGQIQVACQGKQTAGLTSADDFRIFKVPFDATILAVDCITVGGTSLTATFEEQTSAGATGNDIEAAVACDTNGQTQTGALTDALLDAGDWVNFNATANVGTVTEILACVTYVPR